MRKQRTPDPKRILMLLMILVLVLFTAKAPAVFAQENGQTSEEAEEDTENGEDTDAEDDTSDAAGTGASGDAGTGASDAGGEYTSQTVISLVGRYDSADTAPIIRINEGMQTITFRNHDTGRNYTLSYDNASHFSDAYGREISVAQLSPGDLVDVTFLKSNKHLNSLAMATGEDVWVIEELRDYTLPAKVSAYGPSVESMATIAGSKYLMDLRTLVLVDGAESYASAVVDGDIITVCGIGREIYAVKVTRGHGYLRLSSDTVNGTSLVGAWIELDNVAIRKISERMLMTAPEGDYTLYIVGNGANYSAPVTITRGRETIIDTSRIPIEPVRTGDVRFEITPSAATLRVDGTVTDKGVAVPLTYGIHLIELTADGYDTMIRYLRVGSPSAVVRLTMEGDGSSQESSSQSSQAGSSSSGSTSGSSASGSGNSTGGTGQSGTGNSQSDASSNAGSTGGTGNSQGGTGTSDQNNGDNNNNNNGNNNGNNNNNNGNNNGNNNDQNNNNNNGNNQNNNNNNQNNNDNNNNQNNNNQNQNNNNNNQNNQNQNNNNNNQNNNYNYNNGTSNPATFIDGYRIYVDYPRGARLYLDGNFIGYVPVSFDKISGIHTITLQQDGYRTISYNIEVDQGHSDKTYNFPDLIKE